MKILKRETVYEGKFLKFVEKTALTNDNRKVIWETIERTNVYGEGVVTVVAMTTEKEFVMERQWRAALESNVIQFPAGLMDIENEASEETARRELLEETGYTAGKLVPIITAPTNPVLSPITSVYYFAPDVIYTGGEDRDAGEEMDIITVPKDDIGQFLLHLPENTVIDLRVAGIILIMQAKGMV
jgi:ADP-ribose pyrophosphatase